MDLIKKLQDNTKSVMPIMFYEFLDYKNIRNIPREAIFYTIFCILSTIVCFQFSTSYWFANFLRSELITDKYLLKTGAEQSLLGTANLEQIWLAIEHTLTESFVWDHWYKRPSHPYESKEYYDIFLLGVPRLRQLRVRNNTCNIHHLFQSEFEACHSYFNQNNKDMSSFGGNSSDAFHYVHLTETDGPVYSGTVSLYEPGGYIQDLSFDRAETLGIIRGLKKKKWIDRHTRVVFLDMTVYNPNIKTFFTMKIVFELPPSGGVIITTNATNGQLYSLLNAIDFFYFACYLMFFSYVMGITSNVFYGFKVEKWNYLKNKWNLLEVIILILAKLYKLFRFVTSILAWVLVNRLTPKEDVYVDFETLGIIHKHFNSMSGLMLFAIYLKLFKFISNSGTLGHLYSTIKRCLPNIIGFMVVFILFYTAYAFLGYLLFGGYVFEFSTINGAMFILFRSVHEMDSYEDFTQDIYGVVYFVSFMFFMFFLLLNMLLAIINDAYTIVHNEIRMDTPDENRLNFYKRGIYNMLSCKCCKPIRKFFKITKSTQKLSNIKRVLRLAKYKENEMGLFFKKYKIQDDRDITEADADEFIRDVVKNHYHMYEAAEFIRDKKFNNELITPHQLLTQNIQLESLERNVKKLSELINQLEHRKKKIKNVRDNIN